MDTLEPLSVPMFDVQGKLHRIRSLPLNDRRWFLQLRQAAKTLLGEGDFRVFYDNEDSNFRAIVDECLLLHRISPAWVDAYMATRMLFGMGDEPAILMQLNFPALAQDDQGEDIPENLDPVAYQVAALWTATDSLEQALHIRASEPWIEIQATLQARTLILKRSGPNAAEEKQYEESKLGMDRLIQSGRLQDFLDARRNDIELEELPDDYLG